MRQRFSPTHHPIVKHTHTNIDMPQLQVHQVGDLFELYDDARTYKP
jgi:hypothetical protein